MAALISGRASGAALLLEGAEFQIGEKVFVSDRGKNWVAKVLKVEKRKNEWQYFVHYNGWNKKFDEWRDKSTITRLPPAKEGATAPSQTASLEAAPQVSKGQQQVSDKQQAVDQPAKQQQAADAPAKQQRAAVDQPAKQQRAAVDQPAKQQRAAVDQPAKQQRAADAPARRQRAADAPAKQQRQVEPQVSKQQQRQLDQLPAKQLGQDEQQATKQQQRPLDHQVGKQPLGRHLQQAEQPFGGQQQQAQAQVQDEQHDQSLELGSERGSDSQLGGSRKRSGGPLKDRNHRIMSKKHAGEGMKPGACHLSLDVPAPLKKLLLDDHAAVVECGKLIPLPRSPTVTELLKRYVQEAHDQRGSSVNEEEVAHGLRAYFDKSLEAVLLYRSEREHAAKALSEGQPPSSVFGAEHLCRLFIKLPYLLTATSATDEQVANVGVMVRDVMFWMSDNIGSLFLPKDCYISRA